MPSSLFGQMDLNQISKGTTLTAQTSNNAVSVAKSALIQSGGNAKAAFYSLAKQKGVDPNAVINQINSMGNPKTILQSMLLSNPDIEGLFSIFGNLK